MATSASPQRRSQAERSATTREALLDATVACLIEDGYAHTTTSRVAERAGVSRGAHLHHFQTRTSLVAAAIAPLSCPRRDRAPLRAPRRRAVRRRRAPARGTRADRQGAGPALGQLREPAVRGRAGPVGPGRHRAGAARAPRRGRARARPPDARARPDAVPRGRGPPGLREPRRVL